MLSTRTNQSWPQILDAIRKHQLKNHFKWPAFSRLPACSRKGGTKAVHVGGSFSPGAFQGAYTLRSLGRTARTHPLFVRSEYKMSGGNVPVVKAYVSKRTRKIGFSHRLESVGFKHKIILCLNGRDVERCWRNLL